MKHLRNVPEMGTNLLAAGCIGGIGRQRLNRSALGCEAEMMNRLLVREAHDVIAPLHHSLMVLIGGLLTLRAKAQQEDDEDCTREIFHASFDGTVPSA